MPVLEALYWKDPPDVHEFIRTPFMHYHESNNWNAWMNLCFETNKRQLFVDKIVMGMFYTCYHIMNSTDSFIEDWILHFFKLNSSDF